MQKINKIRNFKNVTNCLTSIPMYYYPIIGNQEPGSNLLKAFFLEVMQRSTYSRKKESHPTSGALYQSQGEPLIRFITTTILPTEYYYALHIPKHQRKPSLGLSLLSLNACSLALSLGPRDTNPRLEYGMNYLLQGRRSLLTIDGPKRVTPERMITYTQCGQSIQCIQLKEHAKTLKFLILITGGPSKSLHQGATRKGFL